MEMNLSTDFRTVSDVFRDLDGCVGAIRKNSLPLPDNSDIAALDSFDELSRIVYEDAAPARRMAALERFIAGSNPVEVLVLSGFACRSSDAAVRKRAIERLVERGNAGRARYLIMSCKDELNAEERGWAAESLSGLP
jgi:hypothetical protein